MTGRLCFDTCLSVCLSTGGTPARSDVGGVYPRWGTPSPHTGQQMEYLIRGGRYASCVHAGGLSCVGSIIIGSVFIGLNNFTLRRPVAQKDADNMNHQQITGTIVLPWYWPTFLFVGSHESSLKWSSVVPSSVFQSRTPFFLNVHQIVSS